MLFFTTEGKTMSKYVIRVDVPHYFTIEATTEQEAKAKAVDLCNWQTEADETSYRAYPQDVAEVQEYLD